MSEPTAPVLDEAPEGDPAKALPPAGETVETLRKKGAPWPQVFLAAFLDSGIVTEAAKAAGKGRATVYRHRAKDPDFAAAWAMVEEWSTEELEQVAYKRARDGSDLLLIFLLKARKPGMYRETMKHEHGGKITHAVEEGVDAEIRILLAEVDRLRDRLAKAEPGGQAAAAGGAEGEPVAGAGASGSDAA